MKGDVSRVLRVRSTSSSPASRSAALPFFLLPLLATTCSILRNWIDFGGSQVCINLAAIACLDGQLHAEPARRAQRPAQNSYGMVPLRQFHRGMGKRSADLAVHVKAAAYVPS